MRPTPSILHCDLDAFYASVEQRDNPELRGKPVIVGGSSGRGVVTAASYEARPFGVHSAMPMAQALKLCPHAIVVSSGMAKYAEASKAFFDILEQFSPVVEGLSLDEAFLDVEGEERLLGDGPTIARQIKDRVQRDIDLIVSVGVAPTKFIAKIASDIDKPDGLRVVQPDDVLSFLHPLPVSRLWGVGKVTQRKLDEIGLETIGDLARYPEDLLRKRLGTGTGAHLAALARGEDPRRVVADRGASSIGHEETFAFDFDSAEDIAPILLHQADRVAKRLRRAELRANVVTVKIKYADFKIITRRRTLPDPTCDGTVIGKTAVALLRGVDINPNQGKARTVRLCGVSCSNLEDRRRPEQLTLDEPDRRKGERLGGVLDQIQDKFGNAAIARAATTKRKG